jgi:hypothetical protein
MNTQQQQQQQQQLQQETRIMETPNITAARELTAKRVVIIQ